MAPPDSVDAGDGAPDVETLVARIEGGPGDGRAEAAERLARRLSSSEGTLGEAALDDRGIGRLLPALDDPDPRTRGHVAVALCTVLVGHGGALPGRGVRRLLGLATDGDPRVRRAALHPDLLWRLASFAGSEDTEATFDPREVIALDGDPDALCALTAETLVERLDDEYAVIRKRAATGLSGWYGSSLAHDAELFLYHPDPESAAAALVDGLADPVDGVTRGELNGESVRTSVRRVLRALVENASGTVTAHVDGLDAHLDADRPETRHGAALVLGDLAALHAEELPRPGRVVAVLASAITVEPDVPEALGTLALTRPDVRDEAVDALTEGLGHFLRPVRTACADALVELVRTIGNRSGFDPAVRSLAGIVNLDGEWDEEPLVHLVADYPGFVERRLSALETHPPPAEASPHESGGDLLAAVASADSGVVGSAVEALVADARRGSVHRRAQRTLADLAGERPGLVGPAVADLFDAVGRRPPVGAPTARVVEGGAPALSGIDRGTVRALVGTLGSPSKRERVHAARALVALRRADVPVEGGDLPDELAALEEPYDTDWSVERRPARSVERATDPLVVLADAAPAFAADRCRALARAATGPASIRDAARVLADVADVDPDPVRAALDAVGAASVPESQFGEERLRAALDRPAD